MNKIEKNQQSFEKKPQETTTKIHNNNQENKKTKPYFKNYNKNKQYENKKTGFVKKTFQKLSGNKNLEDDFIEIVGVSFRPAGSIYYYNTNKLDIKIATKVVVNAPKGEMLARVVVAPIYIPKDRATYYDPISKTYDKEALKVKTSSGSIDGTIDHDTRFPKELQAVKRIATEEDLKRHDENLRKTIDINIVCKKLIKENKLNMKLVRTELTLNNKKLSVFYTADARVNFKPLIEALLKEYRGVRIELRQIDVKSETKIIGGLGPCGQELCCSKFNVTPPQVNIKTLKDQNISLNPAKINGLCGKLKCCYNYEIEVYKDIKRNLPKIEKYLKLKTEDGIVVAAKLIRINVLPRTVTAVDEAGSFVTVSVDNIKETSSKPYWKE